MRPSIASALLAQSFVTFMPPIDQKRFTSCATGEDQDAVSSKVKATGDFLAPALHVNLLDVNGSLVPVEIFFSFIRDADGTCVYLVGINVENDRWGTAEDGPSAIPNVDVSQLQRATAIDDLSG